MKCEVVEDPAIPGNYVIELEDKTRITVCPCCALPFETRRAAELAAAQLETLNKLT